MMGKTTDLKLGLKLFPKNIDLIEKLEHIFDFFEIMALPGFKEDAAMLLRKKTKAEFSIHAPHQGQGLDLCDKSKEKENIEHIKHAIRIADALSAKYIIVHPGYIKKGNSIHNMASALSRFSNEKRILIENLPIALEDGQLAYGATPACIKKITSKTGFGFNLDLGHAIVSANMLKKDPEKFLSEFLKIRPSYFHLYGQEISSGKESHSHFMAAKKSSYLYIKKIPKESYVALETGVEGMYDLNTHKEDLSIIKSIRDN